MHTYRSSSGAEISEQVNTLEQRAEPGFLGARGGPTRTRGPVQRSVNACNERLNDNALPPGKQRGSLLFLFFAVSPLSFLYILLSFHPSFLLLRNHSL